MKQNLARPLARIAVALAAALLVASMAPSATANAGGDRGKREQRIQRHLYVAEYYLLRDRDLDAAAAEYRQVLKLDRRHRGASLALAHILIEQGQAKQAAAMLTALIAKSDKGPDSAALWHALGAARAAAGDRKGALEAYRGALAVKPDDNDALWSLFADLNERYRAGERALAAPLRDATAAYLLHATYREGPHYRLAERVQVELSGDKIDLTIYDAAAAYDAAWTETEIGAINHHMGAARSGFEECIGAQPDNQRCHYYLGLIYSSVKASDAYDRDKARAHFARAGSLAESHLALARMLRLEDDLAGAEAELSKALAIQPDYQLALVELGILYKLDGRERKAVTALANAYEAGPYSGEGERALDELGKIDPEHALVRRRVQFGALGGDIFGSERFRAAIGLFEQSYGGIEEHAAEQAALDKTLRRILEAADVDSEYTIQVRVLASEDINALALPNGNIYFTRGILAYLAKRWPDRPIDANNDVIGHIMAHEVAHVIRHHTLSSSLYQEAVKDASRPFDAAVLTHVSRLHEIEADRVGIVAASLAGYHPRGGIEFMEARGQEMEIPQHLDHPTFEERVHYLEEYWTNDVKYAFVSFELGLRELDYGDIVRANDPRDAAQAYERAIDHFRRFRNTLKPTKGVLNNMGVAYAKRGVLALTETGSALHRWRTDLSVERESALKYASVIRGPAARTRGESKRSALPAEFRRAVGLFKEALGRDPSYARARVNLAATYLAMGKFEPAGQLLSKAPASDRAAANLRGIALAERGDHAAAEAAFQAALKPGPTRALPDSVEAWAATSIEAAQFNLARLYQISGRREQARTAYRAYLKAHGKGPWADAARKALKAL